MGRGSNDSPPVPVSPRERYEGQATMDKISALCRRRGFVFPSSDIYGGLGSSYDYGHYGVLLKQNIKGLWQEAMIDGHNDIVALDSAIILNPSVWQASGHVDKFSDPMIDCRTCKKRIRVDQLDEESCPHKPSRKPGQGADCDLTEPRSFNLMFETKVGAAEDAAATVFLRPETAQGIFVNFKNVQQSSRRKPPFGIAQIGKSFRNEITPKNFLFRTREFEQMEMEFFVPPADAEQWYRYWVSQRYEWYVALGIDPANLRVREHEQSELAHYAKATSDIEYLFPIGWSELEGIANRGDYDLATHAAHSGTKLEVFNDETKEAYVPWVIEPAAGVDRAFLAFLTDAYREEEVDGRQRVLLSLHPKLAPIKAAVCPIARNKPELMEQAEQLHAALSSQARVELDDSGQIGRSYRRQDEIGTPWVFTVDHETPDDDCVTVRDRDTMAQERISIDRACDWLHDRLRAAR